jgi:hypothetical protein
LFYTDAHVSIQGRNESPELEAETFPWSAILLIGKNRLRKGGEAEQCRKDQNKPSHDEPPHTSIVIYSITVS